MQELIKIEKNIPRPTSGGRKTTYPWDKMDVGDSFVFPATIKQATAASLVYKIGKVRSKRFSIRSLAEGIRCWRVE